MSHQLSPGKWRAEILVASFFGLLAIASCSSEPFSDAHMVSAVLSDSVSFVVECFCALHLSSLLRCVTATLSSEGSPSNTAGESYHVCAVADRHFLSFWLSRFCLLALSFALYQMLYHVVCHHEPGTELKVLAAIRHTSVSFLFACVFLCCPQLAFFLHRSLVLLLLL